MDRHLPDAPQDSRYYGGRETGEPDDVFTERCPKCDHWSNPDEADENGLCPNCSQYAQEMEKMDQLIKDVGPQAAGLVFILKKLDPYLNPKP